MNWYLEVLKKYADFNGRARRKEYWMFFLFNVIFVFIAMTLDNMLGLSDATTGLGPLYGIYSLAMIIPSIAVAVRRLHDVNKSGWWMFISLVPIIGGIWLLVLMFTESKPGTNQYGINPKGL